MNRTVQFWRLIQPDGKPLAGRFPSAQVLNRLADAEKREMNRHRHCRDGMVLIAHGTAEKDKRILILDKVRRENLPGVGNRTGTRRAIGLAVGEGLLEPTYCVFAKRNIVAMLTPLSARS
ncbi:hypothetical protein [Mycobacterium sp. pW045]|uniref:hypothetical protein n=1 Tax=Mycobacterium sp. pW045 TaxID=3238984 RepID=UPI00351BA930